MRKTSIYPNYGYVIVGGIFDGYTYLSMELNGNIVLGRNDGERIVVSDRAWVNLPDFNFAAPIPPIKVGDRVYAGSKTFLGTVKAIEGEIAAVLWDQTQLNVCKVSSLNHVECNC